MLWSATVLAVSTGCAAGPSPTGGETSTTPETGFPTSAAPAPRAETRTVRIAYRGGQAVGDTGTVSVPLGVPIRLEVTSDVADKAHLHGYDREVQLTPGVPAAIDLTADIPGEFELELHTSGAQLATLQVR